MRPSQSTATGCLSPGVSLHLAEGSGVAGYSYSHQMHALGGVTQLAGLHRAPDNASKQQYTQPAVVMRSSGPLTWLLWHMGANHKSIFRVHSCCMAEQDAFPPYPPLLHSQVTLY
jgi:hypothetical protein